MKSVCIALETPPRSLLIGNSFNVTKGNQTFPPYKRWAFHAYNYRAELRLDDGPAMQIKPGMIGLTPPNTTASYRWLQEDCTHVWSHFVLPEAGDTSPLIPLLIDLGSDYAEFNDQLQVAISVYPRTPQRAVAIMWALLWRLADLRAAIGDDFGDHPALVSATGYIERHLCDELTAAIVVNRAGISHNHLNRLFKAAYGTGILGYIHQRRAKRARQLLQKTSLPIKAVAADIGVPNLQQFNKLIHKIYGRSPRKLRERGDR